ncbi:S24 family peptidase [Pseudomonas sp. UBA6323]|uniref:S24 family peptidase n=1 Tax=Pseudomonas sp. UBA6323 TaxID=1947329 RepID=UPI0025E013AE|nr:S24 family peptidase [Pseudomonas sp. UBA6323]
MDIYEIRRANLRALLHDRFEGKIASLAEALDRAPSYLSRCITDKPDHRKRIGEEFARDIELKLGLPMLSLNYLNTGSEASSAAELVHQMLAKHGQKLSQEARERLIAATNETPAALVMPQRGDEIRIAHYDVQGAMGNGKLVHDFPEMFRDVTVSQQHLRELGVTYKDPAHLKLITGDGQSMTPTIQDKDPMIIDASIREFAGDGIYGFVWQGLFYIKRLQVADAEHFEMISDNPSHKDRLIRLDETYIQGRILLVWRALRV